MDNEKILERLTALERELALYRRAIVITPTKIVIKQSVLIQGLMNADRVYTKRTGSHIEITT